MQADIIEMMWGQLQDEIQQVLSRADLAVARSERAEVAGGDVCCAFADLPYTVDGANKGNRRFVTNGRKIGEGGGAGTGVPAYFNVATNQWLRYSDDSPVAI